MEQTGKQVDQTILSMEFIQQVLEENKRLHAEIARLNANLAWFMRQMFGRKSEKLARLDPNQLGLDFGDFNLSLPEEQQAGGSLVEQIEQIPVKPEKKKAVKPRSQAMEGLPVIEVVIEPEGIDRDRYVRIGEQHTRTLEFEPGKLYVKDSIRPKYALRDKMELPGQGEKTVIIAPLPLVPLYKCMFGSTLIAELLLQKYSYHIPFHRQLRQLRDLGCVLSESTVSGCFSRSCEALRPLYDKIRELVLTCPYIQADETTLPVINNIKHKTDKEYLWIARSVLDGMHFFHYQLGDRTKEVAVSLFKDVRGYLQTDGLGSYETLNDYPDITLVGCMAHCRRKFEAGLRENKKLAEQALSQIQMLYRVERKIRDEKMDAAQSRRTRQSLSKPVCNAFEKWMEENYHKLLPASELGKAIAYTYSRWPRLCRYLEDGNLKIDNNLCENAVRPVACGRNAYLFCGNHRAAEHAAIIYTLLGCCKEKDVNPREWLIDVLEKIPYYLRDKKDLKELLPAYWKKE